MVCAVNLYVAQEKKDHCFSSHGIFFIGILKPIHLSVCLCKASID